MRVQISRALRLKLRTEHILLVGVIAGSWEHGEAIPVNWQITVAPNLFKCVSELNSLVRVRNVC